MSYYLATLLYVSHVYTTVQDLDNGMDLICNGFDMFGFDFCTDLICMDLICNGFDMYGFDI
jgi:hypothetical protein